MQAKDWIMLLVPIFCNGVIIFMLQKMFEKKQISRTVKFEYASIFRQKIDASLVAYFKVLELNNNGCVQDNLFINAIQLYVDSVMELYYYYMQNECIFTKFKNNFGKITMYILELNNIKKKETLDNVELSKTLNNIKGELSELKKACIKLDF